jgi:hypothetical protein
MEKENMGLDESFIMWRKLRVGGGGEKLGRRIGE